MNRAVVVATLAVACLFVASASFADDLCPPPWRGCPLNVTAQWEFIDSDLYDQVPSYFNAVPDGIHDLGPAFTHVHPTEVYWEEDPTEPGDGRAYTGDLHGTLDFFLANFIDDYPDKYIWVQITYGGQGIPWVYEVLAPPWENPNYGSFVQLVPCCGNRVESWMLHPNPDREYVNIEIPPYTWIDQVIIDTISCAGSPVEDGTWGMIKRMYR